MVEVVEKVSMIAELVTTTVRVETVDVEVVVLGSGVMVDVGVDSTKSKTTSGSRLLLDVTVGTALCAELHCIVVVHLTVVEML
jgi:hypothetical protein